MKVVRQLTLRKQISLAESGTLIRSHLGVKESKTRKEREQHELIADNVIPTNISLKHEACITCLLSDYMCLTCIFQQYNCTEYMHLYELTHLCSNPFKRFKKLQHQLSTTDKITTN